MLAWSVFCTFFPQQVFGLFVLIQSFLVNPVDLATHFERPFMLVVDENVHSCRVPFEFLELGKVLQRIHFRPNKIRLVVINL